MSAEVGLKPPKAPPATRSSSIRNFLTGVIHSDSREGDKDKKDAKKQKDTISRRAAAPRPSLDKPPASKTATKESTPDNKTITRASKRLSALPKPSIASSDEKSSSPSSAISPKTVLTRSSSLRPKPRLSGSALPKPKYRPKSELIEAKKPPSPVRAGIRRRLSSSDDEGDDEDDKPKPPLLQLEIPTSNEKSRAISPLPHRNALKVNVTLNTRPCTPPMKGKAPSPIPKPASPSRNPTSKIAKPGKASSTVPSRTAVPRPPSSSSTSSTQRTPRTPKTPKTPPSVRNIFGPSSATKAKPSGSPLRMLGQSTPQHQPDSPLSRITAQKRANGKSSPNPSDRSTPTPTIFTEGASMDSMDADDVEMLLGDSVSPTKPTPAIPRFLRTIPDFEEQPHTPSRSTFLPSRSNMSYLSPAPPTSDSSPGLLRPRSNHPDYGRGSILSWEQLALHNQSLGGEDIGNMLADIAAPFRPGAISPAPSMLSDIPESPSLSALPSPTGFGSISQVLLPDVTPSPAPFNATQRFEKMSAGPEVAAADSAIVTLLKLQLASMEALAKERLNTVQSLESQLYKTKETNKQDIEALAGQVTVLEEQVRSNLQLNEQQSAYTTHLEEQLARVGDAIEEAVQEALYKAQEQTAASQAAALNAQKKRMECYLLAKDAASMWQASKAGLVEELDQCRDARTTLDFLRGQLEHIYLQQQYRYSL
ncbi:hypothetical protein QCA50_001457 [Cerrena zonata]|uniref:Uncharacterized protein n=1 Tax=Cerrena zonata TaxID=2478898 RepID=A0AAW0GX77_9APHY